MIHTDTYIEKEEANAIKALALLLVIWGHNHYLTPLQSTFGYWIYAFHVITFFILPNFYLPKEETFSVFLKKLTARCIIPYTFFYSICFITAFLLNKNASSNYIEFIKGYFHIGGVTTKDAVGFQFIWFIPCYYIFSIIRYCGNRYKYLKSLFIFIGLYLIFIGDDERAYFHRFIPFYLSQATLYYTLGLIAFYLNKYITHFKIIATLIFYISSIFFYLNNFYNNSIIIAISGFFFIWNISVFMKKLKIIQYIGINSFIFYILHVYVYYVIDLISPPNIISQIFCYLLTITCCLIITYFINTSKIRSLLFPRSFSDFKSFFIIS